MDSLYWLALKFSGSLFVLALIWFHGWNRGRAGIQTVMDERNMWKRTAENEKNTAEIFSAPRPDKPTIVSKL